jgi:hypothetical protein
MDANLEMESPMTGQRRATTQAIAWLCLILCGGCGAGIPKKDDATGPPIAYRMLTLADFGARRIPPQFKAHAENVGAALCGQIAITRDSGFSAQRLTHADGSTSYRVGIRHLGFRGEMQPACSWWSPQLPTRLVHRVLQHEQIHFALIELTTRQLNAQARDLTEGFEAIAKSRELAEAAATDTIEAITALALEQLQERHTQFDVESRHHIMPEHQQHLWWLRVQDELARTP